MEDNITDALIMAGSVLLFVLGLSICMFSYSQAREASDVILSYSDRESLTIENDARYYYRSSDSDTSRYVGKETIIPAVYRAYKENYKVIFIFPDSSKFLFKKGTENINKIDLEEQSIGSDEDSREFLNGIVYGKFKSTRDNFQIKYNISLTGATSLNSILDSYRNNYKIEEKLGTYYQEDLLTAEQRRLNKYQRGEIESSDISEVNKTEKRVITYTFKPI